MSDDEFKLECLACGRMVPVDQDECDCERVKNPRLLSNCRNCHSTYCRNCSNASEWNLFCSEDCQEFDEARQRKEEEENE